MLVAALVSCGVYVSEVEVCIVELALGMLTAKFSDKLHVNHRMYDTYHQPS